MEWMTNTRFAYGTKDHLDYQPFNQNYQLFIGRTIYKSRTYELIYLCQMFISAVDELSAGQSL